MRMSEYASKSYIGLDDVRDEPIRGVIKDVGMGSFDRPVIELETGAKFTLNKTNVSILIKALGEDSRDWPGCGIEFYAGQTTYQGSQRESVLVRAVDD